MRVVVIFLLMMSATMTVAQECLCTGTDARFSYTTVNPEDADFMEEFPWQIVSCEPVYDLRFPNEPVMSFNMLVNLVTEDNPHLDTYQLDADENEKVLVWGEWVRFDQFEHSLTEDSCNPPTS